MRSKTVCFTGHRELPADNLPEISKHLEDTLATLIEQGYRYFGAGGALGFDTLATQVILRLRERYPQIRLILVLPCLNQSRGWPQADIDTYEEIKRCADKVTYTSEHYFQGCMQKRNPHCTLVFPLGHLEAKNLRRLQKRCWIIMQNKPLPCIRSFVKSTR